jgi:Zn-dependent protease with chaperone function
MTAVPALLLLCLLLSTVLPRLLSRAAWTAREPVLALWTWQCLVLAVLLCCSLALLLSLSALWPAARAVLFSGAPPGVEAAYGMAREWAGVGALVLAVGGFRTALALVGEVHMARLQRRRRERELSALAPELPLGLSRSPRERTARERLVVLEDVRPEAWSLPGPSARLVVTTGALRRLNDQELAAVLAHERGHVRARHHWLISCAEALSAAFPGARVFTAFREETGRLVELAADDTASRRHGRLAVALALLELNDGRAVFGGCPAPRGEVPERVDRLLAGEPRLSVGRRMRLTAAALAVPAVPVLLAFAPGLHALL